MGLRVELKFLFQLTLVVSLFHGSTAANGLKVGFYKKTCPGAEAIVGKTVAGYVEGDPAIAAPILRLHFHDYFVRGCDGSVLLNSTRSCTAEKDVAPNLSLDGFFVIDAAKAAVEKACPWVVSCADIVALAARDAVSMINGPHWEVQTGRRDGKISLASETLQKLPSSCGNIAQHKANFKSKGLTAKDLVILSGAHTIGKAHCSSIYKRLDNFTGKCEDGEDRCSHWMFNVGVFFKYTIS